MWLRPDGEVETLRSVSLRDISRRETKPTVKDNKARWRSGNAAVCVPAGHLPKGDKTHCKR